MRAEQDRSCPHWSRASAEPWRTRPPRGRPGSSGEIRLEFFTLSFEDGFVHVVCQGRIPPDDIVFLIDMILEKLDEIRDVEPRNPTAVV